jgi:hypothetical protein
MGIESASSGNAEVGNGAIVVLVLSRRSGQAVVINDTLILTI